MDACIAAVETDWIRKLLTFLRFTGLRVGETMLLRWADLDLERRLLTIEPGITKPRTSAGGLSRFRGTSWSSSPAGSVPPRG